MKVKDLIAKLSELDGNAPVWTINTCDCCTTFVELEAANLAEHHLAELRLTTPSAPDGPEISEATAAWSKPLVVIAAGLWSESPKWPDRPRPGGGG